MARFCRRPSASSPATSSSRAQRFAFGVDYGGDATAVTEDATATLTVAADLASGPVRRRADAHSVVSHLYAPHRVSGVDREAEGYPI